MASPWNILSLQSVNQNPYNVTGNASLGNSTAQHPALVGLPFASVAAVTPSMSYGAGEFIPPANLSPFRPITPEQGVAAFSSSFSSPLGFNSLPVTTPFAMVNSPYTVPVNRNALNPLLNVAASPLPSASVLSPPVNPVSAQTRQKALQDYVKAERRDQLLTSVLRGVWMAVGSVFKMKVQQNAIERQREALRQRQQAPQHQSIANKADALFADALKRQQALNQLQKQQDERYKAQGGTIQEPSAKAKQLANIGRSVAKKINKNGECAKGVRISLQKAGIPMKPGPNAHQYAKILKNNPNFEEVPYDKRLPGDVVVLAKSASHEHGHIYIKQEVGESSDHVSDTESDPRPYGGVAKAKVFRLVDA